MANIELLVPVIFKWEGGWSDNTHDDGGKTNMGITLSTWKSQGYDKDCDGDIDADDLKLITHQDVINILRQYWNRWQADTIINQSIANLLVDWVWNSGAWGIKKPQLVLGLKDDGIVGPKTLAAINEGEQSEVFSKIWKARKQFFNEICERDHKQLIFLQGWLNRLNDFKFKA